MTGCSLRACPTRAYVVVVVAIGEGGGGGGDGWGSHSPSIAFFCVQRATPRARVVSARPRRVEGAWRARQYARIGAAGEIWRRRRAYV